MKVYVATYTNSDGDDILIGVYKEFKTASRTISKEWLISYDEYGRYFNESDYYSNGVSRAHGVCTDGGFFEEWEVRECEVE